MTNHYSNMSFLFVSSKAPSHTHECTTTHKDESNPWVRWPLPSPLSHVWRSFISDVWLDFGPSFTGFTWLFAVSLCCIYFRYVTGCRMLKPSRNTDAGIFSLSLYLSLVFTLIHSYSSSFSDESISMYSTDKWCMCSHDATWRGSTAVSKQICVTATFIFGSPLSSWGGDRKLVMGIFSFIP